MATDGVGAGAGVEPGSDFLPFVEKYRPATLDDVVSHDDIVSTINRLIDSAKLPHLLFYGPPGTGKTSTILACARRLYGEKLGRMVLELNASDDRGIDIIRNEIKGFAGTKKLFSKGVKLVILDEADAMTSDAQFALRRVIEKYTSNTRFCLICNYVSKIIPALQSRCTRFRFGPLKRSQIESRLQHVITAEGITVTDDGMNAILRLGGGDMRRVLNVLQATQTGGAVVNERNVYACTGDPLPVDVREVVQRLLNDGHSDAFTKVWKMCTTKGYALGDIITQVGKYVARLQFPPPVRAFLLSKLADIEHRLAFATSDKLQLAALVGAFVKARYMVSEAKKGEE